MEEVVEQAIIFMFGLLLIFVTVFFILPAITAYNAQQSITYFDSALTTSVSFYLENSTLFVVNSGGPISIGRGTFTGFTSTGKSYIKTLSLTVIPNGVSRFFIQPNTISGNLVIYSTNLYYVKTIPLIQQKLLEIKNMYSSTYVYINGKLTQPLFQNLSTYYFPITSDINSLKLMSSYFNVYKPYFVGTNYTLPLTIKTLNISFLIQNGTQTFIPTNEINIKINNIQSYNNYNIASGTYNNIINIPYSGKMINITYCYEKCTNTNIENGTYFGPVNSTIKLKFYKTSRPVFYIETANDIVVPGESTLVGISNYSFPISDNGTHITVKNGKYIAEFSSFNHFVAQKSITINGSGPIYLYIGNINPLLVGKPITFKPIPAYQRITEDLQAHPTGGVPTYFNFKWYEKAPNNNLYSLYKTTQTANTTFVTSSANLTGNYSFYYTVEDRNGSITKSPASEFYLNQFIMNITQPTPFNSTINIGQSINLTSNILGYKPPYTAYWYYGYTNTTCTTALTSGFSVIDNSTLATVTPKNTTYYCAKAEGSTGNFSAVSPVSVVHVIAPYNLFINTSYGGMSVVINKTTYTTNTSALFDASYNYNYTFLSTYTSPVGNLYTFKNVSLCNKIIGTTNTGNFVMKASYANCTLEGDYNNGEAPFTLIIHNSTSSVSGTSVQITFANGTTSTCKTTCNYYVPLNQKITLTAVNSTTGMFKNYTGTGAGSYSGTNSITTFTINNPITETANFIPKFYFSPITLTNSQTVATLSGFQQQIIFNPSTYSSYENGNLGNIRFYYGTTELYSWCESGCSNTSTNTVFWVKLPFVINGSSSAVINMTFEQKTVNYDKNYAGEAPNMTSTYGQYDNGAKVFNFYSNFKGTSLNTSKWTAYYGTNNNYVVSNGITVNPESSESGTSPPEIYTTTYTTTGPIILDFYGEMDVSGKTGVNNLVLLGLINSSNDNNNFGGIGNFGFSGVPHDGLVAWGSSGSDIYADSPALNLPNTNSVIYSIELPTVYSTSTTLNGFSNYGNKATISGIDYSGWSGHLGFISQSSGETIGPIYWIRTRLVPPNGIMPSITIGNVQSG